MKINMEEMNTMVDATNELGTKAMSAYNKLCSFALEHGLSENPDFMRSLYILSECVFSLRDQSFERGVDLCKKNSIIESLRKFQMGRYLVDQITNEEA